jgi:pantoate--beta-alanine ligase
VDHLFHPGRGEFYAPNHSIHVTEQSLARHLCGATRPGHFDGVCTVVLKLLNLVAPDYAFFGKKDYQQLAIIRRLVRDLSIPVTISACETLREEDGLAMSSRNRNLNCEQRGDAPRLRKALLAAESLAPTGERDPSQYLASARQQLAGAPSDFRLDYLELVSRQTLQPLATMKEAAVLAIAAFYGETRLIDNIEIEAA